MVHTIYSRIPLLFVLLLSVCSPAYAERIQDTPLVTVLPFLANNVSQAELQLFEDYLSSCIAETGEFRVLERRQRDMLLLELGRSLEGCTDEQCRLEVGRMLSADRIIIGSMGNIADRYIITVKLIQVETGETLKTKSERYPSFPVLIDMSREFIFDFVGASGGKEPVGMEEAVRLDFEYRYILDHIKAEEFARWAEDLSITADLETESPERRLSIAEAYLSEKLPVGFQLHYGLVGGCVNAEGMYYEGLHGVTLPGLYELDEPIDIHPTGFNAGAVLGLMYRFPSRIGVGVWLGAYYGWYTDVGEYSLSLPEQLTYSENFLNTFGVTAFMDFPLRLDGIGLILGMGSGSLMLGDQIYPCVGIRIGSVILRYSFGIGALSGNHQLAFLLSTSLGGEK